MKRTFLKREVTIKNEDDGLSWCVERSGKYSMKMGYLLLTNEQILEDWPYTLCCDKDFVPKVGAFSYLANHRDLVTT